MIKSFPIYLKKNAPTFAAIGGMGGFVGDVLAPLMNFSLYLLYASLIGLAIAGVFYMYFSMDEKVTQKENAITHMVFFAVFAVIWGAFTAVHVFGPENGVVATAVPQVEQFQEEKRHIIEDRFKKVILDEDGFTKKDAIRIEHKIEGSNLTDVEKEVVKDRILDKAIETNLLQHRTLDSTH